MIIAIMIFFGALGGIAQGLLASDGALRLPDRRTEGLQLGFLSDAFIGSLGGLGSLIVAAILLNALNAGLVSTADGPVKAIFGEVPPWALQASFGIFAGFTGRRLLPAVSDRLARAIEDKVHSATEGVQQRVGGIAADQMSVVMDQMAALSARPAPPVDAVASAPLDTLRALVDEYEGIEAPTWSERVARKDECYRRMSQEIVTNGIAIGQLTEVLREDPKQGWVLALVALVSAQPEAGQATLLLDKARLVTWKHVMYRVASAIGILTSQRKISRTEVDQARRVFDAFPNPDRSLTEKFESTRTLMSARYASLG